MKYFLLAACLCAAFTWFAWKADSHWMIMMSGACIGATFALLVAVFMSAGQHDEPKPPDHLDNN